MSADRGGPRDLTTGRHGSRRCSHSGLCDAEDRTEFMTAPLAGKTIVMSGGSRGIGLAIALRAAADAANLVLIAKTDTPHPKLSGTIHSAAEQIREAGGRALPVVGDIRSDDTIAEAVTGAIETFGGID